MDSNGFAKVLKRNSWRLTTILVYAVLEWVLIFLLLISALFQYITTKFASFFGLHPPCLWCSRLDHILEPKEPDFYRKLICERHAKEISLLSYCLNHRKLEDAHRMCEECAFSRPAHVSSSAESNGSKPSWITCMSMVADTGFDLSKKAVTKGWLTNRHVDDFKAQGAELYEKPMNGWVCKELCSCCNALMDHKLYSHNIFNTILFGHEEAILKSQWNALDYAGNSLERVFKDEDGLKKQSRCVCGGTQVKISEVFVDSPNESDAGSSSSVSDGEIVTREEKVDSSSIHLEEIARDVSETHCNQAPDEAQTEHRSLEIVQDDEESTVDVQSDIYVDKRIAYPDIDTQECAMVSDVTVTEMAIDDTPNDQVIKRLAFVEEPLEIDGLNSEAATEDVGDLNQPSADAEDLNEESTEDVGNQTEASIEDVRDLNQPSADVEDQNEESIEDAGDQNEVSIEDVGDLNQPYADVKDQNEESIEDVGDLNQPSADVKDQNEESIEDVGDQNEASIEDVRDQNEAAAVDSVCNSLQVKDSTSEVMAKGLDDSDASDSQTSCSDAGSVEVLPNSLEVSSNADNIPAEMDQVEEKYYVTVMEQGDSALENTNGDDTEHSLEDTVAVLKPFPMNRHDRAASLISDGAADEAQDLEDSEADGRNELQADHHSADIFIELQATSTDVATQEATATEVVTEEATIEISEGMDMDSRKEGIDAGECQVSEDIGVTTREDQACNGCVEGGLNEKSIQNMDQNDTETGHHVHDEADKMDEDRASETPRSIEGIQFRRKRMIIDRKDSSAESLDGSVLSEIGGESEADRLKHALEAERKTLNTLYSELEEERNAAAIAANQTMAMITRLQEEKAAVQMEALQYQRMMEEQSEYDQEALQLLNEILVKREKENQELEKELELYRKRLLRYESKARRMEKKMKAYESERQTFFEKGEETPDNQSCRNRTSSSSSLSDNSDDFSSDPNDVDEQFEAQERSQNTPSDLIMSSGRGYGDAEQKTSLDESLVDFEEETISILEQLKVLEEKLHTFANDDQAGMAHPETNGIQEDMKGTDVVKETLEAMNGIGTPTARRVARGKGKRLLPLFDAISVEEVSLHHTEEFSSPDSYKDWHTVSMVLTDNNRLVIEEEVYNLYERLQALEADREFLKHTIKSLRKGDEGMKLLQEIAQHLRDLRRVELKARNFSDLM